MTQFFFLKIKMNNNNICCDRKKKRLQEKTPNCYHQEGGKKKKQKKYYKSKKKLQTKVRNKYIELSNEKNIYINKICKKLLQEYVSSAYT